MGMVTTILPCPLWAKKVRASASCGAPDAQEHTSTLTALMQTAGQGSGLGTRV